MKVDILVISLMRLIVSFAILFHSIIVFGFVYLSMTLP